MMMSSNNTSKVKPDCYNRYAAGTIKCLKCPWSLECDDPPVTEATKQGIGGTIQQDSMR